MNVWKPVALCLAAGLVVSIGIQTASAAGKSSPEPIATPDGPCHGQGNMAAALASLQSAVSSLRVAENDKGGWRTAAIGSAENALAKTQTGCTQAP